MLVPTIVLEPHELYSDFADKCGAFNYEFMNSWVFWDVVTFDQPFLAGMEDSFGFYCAGGEL